MRLLAVIAILAAACTACGSDPLAPVAAPRASFDAALIAKGAQLAAIGNCRGCHSAEGGRSFAGGRPIDTPFGTFYGTNITPDPDTGIGQWSEQAFRRALREGLDREGHHLYPAFPYEYYTRLTDEDIHALYAYIATREAVRADNRPHELRAPFNIRALLGAWKALYFEPGVFRADPARDVQWNRGAYLVNGLGHCGACHTPRGFLGGEKKDQLFAGGIAEGWHGPALNAGSPAPVPWSAEQLFKYLRTGLDEVHAIAAGPMDPVVRNLARAPEADVRAMAAYLEALAGPPSAERRKKADAALAQAKAASRANGHGAEVYAGTCAACHDRGREAGSGGALPLALGTAMTIPTSSNLLRITLEGIAPPEGEAGRAMPGFADALTDAQVKDLAAYIRSEFGRAPAWTDLDGELKKIRQEKK
ncbi:MAG: c-type cytochrome [Burkholderiales bacterium]